MKDKRMLIAIGVALALACAAILVLGSYNGQKKSSSPLAVDASWTKLLDRLLSPLAPRLHLEDLQCNGQKAGKTFELTGQEPSCTLDVSPGLKGDHAFWKTEVRLSQQNKKKPDIAVKAKFTDEALKNSKPDEQCTQTPNSEFFLAVDFSEKQSGEVRHECWYTFKDKESISLTLLEQGGTLALSCFGCTPENGLAIALKLK